MLRHIIDLLAKYLEGAEPLPAPPPLPKVETWSSDAYLDSLRAGARCPFCAKEKASGVLMCVACEKFRESLRKKAAS